MEQYTNLTGDGTTKTFYFTFPFFGVNDIHVKVNNVAQSTDDYTLTPTQTPNDADTEYTGGSIEFTAAPANGATITIYREIDLVRHIDYQPTEKPLSHQLNQDFNQCIGALRELKINLKNTLVLASIPTLADLLASLETISGQLDTFLTADDLTDINTAISGISDKANKTLDNITANGKTKVANLAMPSSSYIDYTLTDRSFTAPANGYFNAIAKMGSNSNIRWINNTNGIAINYMNTGNDTRNAGILIPAKTGDELTLAASNVTSMEQIRFIYAQGEI